MSARANTVLHLQNENIHTSLLYRPLKQISWAIENTIVNNVGPTLDNQSWLVKRAHHTKLPPMYSKTCELYLASITVSSFLFTLNRSISLELICWVNSSNTYWAAEFCWFLSSKQLWLMPLELIVERTLAIHSKKMALFRFVSKQYRLELGLLVNGDGVNTTSSIERRFPLISIIKVTPNAPLTTDQTNILA